MKALKIIMSLTTIFGLFAIVYNYLPDKLPYISIDFDMLIMGGAFILPILLLILILRWGDLI